MLHENKITSLQNPKIKALACLKERKERDETGLFVIEGAKEIMRARDAGVVFQSLFICPDFLSHRESRLLVDQMQVEKYFIPPHIFQSLAYRKTSDGLIGVAYQMKLGLKDIKMKNPLPLVVIAESIEKPGNLGTILRSADGVGADAVIVCDRCTDIYNPNVVRASIGTLFTLPVVEASSLDVHAWLKQNNICIVSTSPDSKLEYTGANLNQPVAIVVGAEQMGLSDLWMQESNLNVTIPMRGCVDSLNVASATTLLLYETLRQRRHPVL